jgi:hypothetical protein
VPSVMCVSFFIGSFLSLSFTMMEFFRFAPFNLKKREKGKKKNVFPTLLMSLTTPENVSFLKGADTCRLWAIL